MKTRVLIVDDHQVVIDGLSSLIASMRGFEVVGSGKNGWDALQFIEENEAPDILLMDITMPDLDGIETMEKLHEASSPIAVIMLSMHLSVAYAQRLLELGVKGYLQKDCDVEELQEALKNVRDGGTYLSKNVTELLVENRAPSSTESQKKKPLISPREKEVLLLLQEEKSSRMIAKELSISFNTVETHRKHLLNKFAVNSTVGLIREADAEWDARVRSGGFEI